MIGLFIIYFAVIMSLVASQWGLFSKQESLVVLREAKSQARPCHLFE
jgi:hypothetical protein